MTANPREWIPHVFMWLGKQKPETVLLLLFIMIHAAGLFYCVEVVAPKLIEQVHSGYVEILERAETLEDRRQQGLHMVIQSYEKQAAENRAFWREMEMRR